MLQKLSDLMGVSGHEGRVRSFIRETIAPYVDEMKIDAMGNLIAHKKGAGRRVMLSCHMDEVGMLVKGVTDDGLLAIECRSIDPRVLVSKRVVVGENDLPGVIGAKAIHQQSRHEFETALKYDELYVDIGAKDKDDALKSVAIGDPIGFTTRFAPFGDGLMKGKALDDRIGCAAVIELLKNSYECDLYAAFTVQEECGLRGARIAANRVMPEVSLNFEGTTASDVPESLGHQLVTRVGDGPAFTFMDATALVRPQMLKALVDSAKACGAKYQIRRGAAGGTDMGAISLAGAGCVYGNIAVPCRYIHSPCSVASMQDYQDMIKIGHAFLADKKYDEVIV